MNRKMLLVLSVMMLVAVSAFAQYAPPANLTAQVTDSDVYLAWDEPAGAQDLLRWDDGTNTGNAIGLNGAGGVFTIAARFSPTELTPFDGMVLSQIEIYANDEAPLTLKVWTGGSWNGATGSSGTEVLSQELTGITWESFNMITLSTPVTIDASAELWFGYEVDDPGEGVFPAGCDAGPATNYWGNLILSGTSWASLVDLAPALNYDWNLGGYLTTSRGEIIPLTHQAQPQVIRNTGASFEEQGATGIVQTSNTRNRAVTSYKIYRDGTEIAENTDPTVLDYTDAGLEPATYEYYVTAIWEEVNESEASNTAEAIVLPIAHNPPQNLTATVNGHNVVLQWEEPGTGGGGNTEELIYDNDTPTDGYTYNGSTMALHMTPEGPCQVITLKYYTTGSGTFNAEVYNYENSAPGTTLLHNVNGVAGIDGDWLEVDIASANLQVNGDFMVGFGSINATLFLGFDGNLDNGRSFDFSGEAWSAWDEAYHIRAIVMYPDGSTAELEPGVTRDRPDVEAYNVYRDEAFLGSTSSMFYTDINMPTGTYEYYVTAVYTDEVESEASNTVEAVGANNGEINPVVTALGANTPNPFNPETSIAFSLEQAGPVTIEVYNVRGQLVKSLVNDTYEVGAHSVVWHGDDNNGAPAASGMYFYKMKAGRYTATKKMILLK